MRRQSGGAVIIAMAVVVLGVVLFLAWGRLRDSFFQPTDSSLQPGVNQAVSETVATNLTVPWGIAFLPGGDLLITERSGTLRRVGQDRQVHQVEGVVHIGEGGLMGLALHPGFSQNRWLYLYLTTRAGDRLTNRIERYTYQEGNLGGRKIILSDIPGAANHDGGRLAFGPDGYLYATTGDAGDEPAAQSIQSLAGKILRLTDEGGIPTDNPFSNAVYSYGHRNPQGLAWDERGRLWSTEHGRSGIRSGFDELNLIKKGVNYGWPLIEGDASRTGMEKPVIHSGASETWAPASLSFADGSLFFGGLRGQSLYEAKINTDGSVSLRAHLSQKYGRLRTVAASLDGKKLYLTTSNTDGRGEPQTGDDKLVRLNLSIFR